MNLCTASYCIDPHNSLWERRYIHAKYWFRYWSTGRMRASLERPLPTMHTKSCSCSHGPMLRSALCSSISPRKPGGLPFEGDWLTTNGLRVIVDVVGTAMCAGFTTRIANNVNDYVRSGRSPFWRKEPLRTLIRSL